MQTRIVLRKYCFSFVSKQSCLRNCSVIHDLIQQHVVEHFGYRHVNALRTALHRFPDDPAVKATFYGKSILKDTKKNSYFRVLAHLISTKAMLSISPYILNNFFCNAF